jgi:hypothetical protein
MDFNRPRMVPATRMIHTSRPGMIPATSRKLVPQLAIGYGIAQRATGTTYVNARPEDRFAVMSGMGALAEFGDLANGVAAQAEFRTLLETHISAKAGPAYLANAKAAPTLGGAIGMAASAFTLGEANGLDPVAQASWNQWRAAASGPNSDYNIYWMFGRMVQMNKDALTTAWVTAKQSGWWDDVTAAQASFTLLDSSTTGTTWLGGTTVTSKLDNSQWSSVFVKAWAALQKGVNGQVLSLTYLDVLVKGMLAAPASRRMPMFQPPPGNLPANDPAAVAFRAMLKQFGWNDVVHEWYTYTAQAWAAQSDAQDSQDSTYASVITGLNYLSGKAIYDQINAKLQDYWSARTDAAAQLKVFDTLAKGPLSGQIPQADTAAMAAIRQSFLDTDSRAVGTLTPLGLWPAGQAQGAAALNGLHGLNGRGLSDLGLVQVILAGAVAVAALGVVAYIVATMTKTARDAAAQTKATTDSILATVDALKASCTTTYMASAKDAPANAAYQDCLMKTKTLTDTIPDVPESSSDPLGLGKIVMLAGIALVGIVALSAMKNKKSSAP